MKKEKKNITGIIELTRKAVGYLALPPGEDIQISTQHLAGALNGDEVEVSLTSLYPRPVGKVVAVLSRAKSEFVCTIRVLAGKLVALPDDGKFYKPIQIDTLNYAEGEKVLVKLISFDGTTPKGSVVEHLGRAGEHRVEMNAIVLEHGFRVEFPPEAAAEAREIEINHAQTIDAQAKVRSDFRTTPTFTIDPATAKDFDDALSVKKLPSGEFEIGVHIADVTHFVKEGSTLEDEVKKRGTSVYLVDATIPMLPEELSGNVCSLKPNEDRLAFSAIFRLNSQGDVLDRKFEKTIIRSQHRFTYESAQEVLDGGFVNPRGFTKPPPFREELTILRILGRLLHQRRELQGAIDFGDNEFAFTLDEKGKPIAIKRKLRLETMRLIEEFMLLANREVSTYVSDLAKKVPEKGLVFLYRIHDVPKADRIEELSTFVRAIGYEFGRAKKKHSASDIARLLEQIKGKPEEHLIRTATLRSMAKAIYSTKNIGHFGLAFEYYTHFTSPIRRYPDMLAHRILASHLDGKPITRREFVDLEKLCIKASEQEAKAVDAERESIRYKQVEYMSEKVGQQFEAVISGVTDWGLYVEEPESGAEGLVRINTIGDEYFNYVQKEYSLVGQKTKKKYSLGDKVKVKLTAADLSARTLDFELVR